jgi:hypothetical protein
MPLDQRHFGLCWYASLPADTLCEPWQHHQILKTKAAVVGENVSQAEQRTRLSSGAYLKQGQKLD